MYLPRFLSSTRVSATNKLAQIGRVRTYLAYTSGVQKKKVTLIPGDGIGPEIVSSVQGIFRAANVPIEWELYDVSLKSTGGPQISQEVVASISRNKVALKGPFYTPLLSGAPSRNLELRKALDLYAHIIPCKSFEGLTTRHAGVPIDIVVIRENTQGEYTGLEQELTPGVVQSLKVVTREASLRIARYAFEYAKNEKRKKVTAIHKANIQKLTDGLFLECCREVAKEYPEIEFGDMIIDNCCMQLVMKPQQFDVMVTPNLYGNLVTNVVAALVGGPGLAPGANVGERAAIFESGAHHVASDIAGQDKANPTSILLSATMMLRHIDLPQYADLIENAVRSVISEKKTVTADLAGTATTKEFTNSVIAKISSSRT
jgi:isocitrate dehydrogenase (NAD+)